MVNTEIRLILFFAAKDREALYSQQKQDQELTVAQIMNSLLPKEEKGTTEDEMAGWHQWLDGRESEWTLEVGDGQGGLACCDSWGRKESDTTEQLNWTHN